MKNLYEVYGTDAKLAQLVREIGWSHNITILEKCKSGQEREVYIRSCRKFGWFRNVVVHQMDDANTVRQSPFEVSLTIGILQVPGGEPVPAFHRQLSRR